MKIFFSDYDAGVHVPADAPRDVELDEALDVFDTLPRMEGCFLGLIDDQERVIQFMYNGDGSITVDIPVEDKGGSMRRDRASFEDCRKLLTACAKGVHIEAIPGLEFARW